MVQFGKRKTVINWGCAALAAVSMFGCGNSATKNDDPTQNTLPPVGRGSGDGPGIKRSWGPDRTKVSNPNEKYLLDVKENDFLEIHRPLVVEMKALDKLLHKYFKGEDLIENRDDVVGQINKVLFQLEPLSDSKDTSVSYGAKFYGGSIGALRKALEEENPHKSFDPSQVSLARTLSVALTDALKRVCEKEGVIESSRRI